MGYVEKRQEFRPESGEAPFESDCLMRELALRDTVMGNPVSSYIIIFCEMMRLASELKQATADITQKFKEVSVVPTNMRITAARLEPAGGAGSSLAQNYWAMSKEVSEWFNANVNDDDTTLQKFMKHGAGRTGIRRMSAPEITKYHSKTYKYRL